MIDRYGFVHHATRRGVAEFEEATHAVLAYLPEGANALASALAADASHVAAHALTGLGLVIQARAELIDRAREARSAAHRALLATPTRDEVCLLEALDLALDGKLAAAADRFDHTDPCRPPSLLRTKLANLLRFQLGDANGMARGTAEALAALPPDAPGRSYIVGCHAFALEELGDYSRAERLGRHALQIEPNDPWAIHAVAHTFEMRDMPREGVAWMESQRPIWRSGNFGFHSAWHLALFHLELGEFDRVLELYDGEIRPRPTPDVRDFANCVSMLWRLQQFGLKVGTRWDELADIARQRVHDTSMLFFTLHYLMALLAVGDERAAVEVVAAIDHAAIGDRDQSVVARRIGSPLARAMLDLSRRQGGRQRLDQLALQLQRLGGSAAQRDLFVRTLAMGALESDGEASFAAVIAARRATRSVDRFDRFMHDTVGFRRVAA